MAEEYTFQTGSNSVPHLIGCDLLLVAILGTPQDYGSSWLPASKQASDAERKTVIS